MIVYIDESGGSQDKLQVLAALCVPREADVHLSPFLFKLKKEIYEKFTGEDFNTQKAAEIKAGRILKRSRFEAAIKRANQDKREAREIILLDEIFQNLASNPAFEKVKIFAGVMEGRRRKSGDPQALPLEYFYLLQRIDRLVEEEYPMRAAFLHFDLSDYPNDRMLFDNFSSLVHGYRKRGQFVHIHPTPFFVDSRLTPGIELVDLIAGVIRIAYENGLGWEGVTEKPLEALQQVIEIAEDTYLSYIKGYYRIIHSKTCNWLKSKSKLFGIYLLSPEKFVSEEAESQE